MIYFCLDPAIEHESHKILTTAITQRAKYERLEATVTSLDDLADRLQTHHGSSHSLVSVGSMIYANQFITLLKTTLAHTDGHTTRHILIGPNSLPLPLRRVVFGRLIAQEMRVIAARKVVEKTVFQCGDQIFLDSITLVSPDAAPIPLRIDAHENRTHFLLKAIGSRLSLTVLSNPEQTTTPLLQLRVESTYKTGGLTEKLLGSHVANTPASSSTAHDVLHLPITQATIRSTTQLVMADDTRIKLPVRLEICSLPWQLRVIATKSSSSRY